MGQGRTEDLNQPRYCGDDLVPLPLVRGLGFHGGHGESSKAPARVLKGLIDFERDRCLSRGKRFHYENKSGDDVDA